ncbi:hypothetical protein BU24DRAFT_411890 [Aaosphaeria arxii CBS 175.79]|uniref:Uncharacterized protein n=1 Tax=Aaosphaeria arxii CBS 175.79 TaxID=1450172 RepID=A0A6A5XHE4_9PLEO|nr:uncharacterized protein BU24DRAFT_411890 [Aaosphaeria arxii CBS 175.79]KAF2012532.1 hypothetical protein BU24DRAFT_411890 [Aaosphaeria arxii CBS 175.79]
MADPFTEADAEWSDEEALIPKGRRRSQYMPQALKITKVVSPQPLRPTAWRDQSSDSSNESPLRDFGLSPVPSPLIPPKSPSRPEIQPGSHSHENLVQRFYQVTKERDALRKELQRKSVGTNSLPGRESVVYKSEEKTLIEDLHNLRYSIREWSEEYFSGPLTSRSKRPHLHSGKDMFGNLSDNYSLYLKHQRDRPLLIQAYVWNRLQRKVFNTLDKGCGYVWAGRLGDRKMRSLNDTLRQAVTNEEQAAEYHKWRAMTVNLLVPQVEDKENGGTKLRPTFDASPILKRIKRFCSRLRSKLRPWSTQSLRLGKDRLYSIVSAAVALDLKMKRQRADYRFVTFTGGKPDQLYGYSYYDSEMEDIEEDINKARRVELSVAPALERCGNANGHIFENSFILVKADVSCRRLEKKRPPSASKKQANSGTKSGVRSVMNMWDKYA